MSTDGLPMSVIDPAWEENHMLLIGLIVLVAAANCDAEGSYRVPAERPAIAEASAQHVERFTGAWRGAMLGLDAQRIDIAQINGHICVRWSDNASRDAGHQPWHNAVVEHGTSTKLLVRVETAGEFVTTTFVLLETGELEEVVLHEPKRLQSWSRAPFRYVSDATANRAIAMLDGRPQQQIRAAELLLHIGAPAALSAVPKLAKLVRPSDSPKPSNIDVRRAAMHTLLVIAPDDADAMSAIISCLDERNEQYFLDVGLQLAPRLFAPHVPPSVRAEARVKLLAQLRDCEQQLDGSTNSANARKIAVALGHIAEGDSAILTAIKPWALIMASDAAREREAREILSMVRLYGLEAGAAKYVIASDAANIDPKTAMQRLYRGESISCEGLKFWYIGDEPGEVLLRTSGRAHAPTTGELEQLSIEARRVIQTELKVRADLELSLHQFVDCFN